MTALTNVKGSIKLAVGRLRAIPLFIGQTLRRFATGHPSGAGRDIIPQHEADAAALAEAELDAEAEADYRAGRILENRDVREWLTVLADGDKTPPPGVA